MGICLRAPFQAQGVVVVTKTVLIVGAGPAGLTAAHELLRARAGWRPIVLESDTQVGGISKTVNYRGNRMDLGGHRFFSKSDWVMNFWQEILPVADDQDADGAQLAYQGQSRDFAPALTGNAGSDAVMLVRPRLSRIYYQRKFFDYPLRLSIGTVSNLGWIEAGLIGTSYLKARAFPRRDESTLEDFFINRFGDRLYHTFFKDYTEKVWGVPCTEISAEWGAQRVKGLSITKALQHALSSALRRGSDVRQKEVETSLIERFLYPKLGPGQMWETVAARVKSSGGEVLLCQRVTRIHRQGQRITGADVLDSAAGTTRHVECDALISTMPIADLARQLEVGDPEVMRIATRLPYRDFMTAGLVVRKMTAAGPRVTADTGMPPDNWIYIQEPDVKLGRLQIFNNWSPHLVANPGTVSLGLEYFCAEGDQLWSMPDQQFLRFAAEELAHIGLIRNDDVLDGTVVRVPKAYPAYFGEYRGIGKVRACLDGFENLFPVGRNGMHRYNNQDHSMLAAKAAVDAILGGSTSKAEIWAVNTEDDYHEESSGKERAAA
jgi:protoporphyrinogen oxidase